MKLKSSLKFAQVSILAAMTIASAIASSITPSLATQPTEIIRATGQPEVIIFGDTSQSFEIGCQPLRDIWKDLKTQQINIRGYRYRTSSSRSLLVGKLLCNSTQVQGVISPAFGSNVGVILVRGNPFYVKTDRFFSTMGITPNQLSDRQAQSFLEQYGAALKKNTVLETMLPNVQVLPKPPGFDQIPVIRTK